MSIWTEEGWLSKLPCHTPWCSGRAYRRTHQLARPRLCLSMIGLVMVVVAVVIPTGSSLSRVRSVQPCCSDIQVFIRLLSTFHPRLRNIATPLTLMLKTSSSTDLSTSATQTAVGFDGVDGGGGKLVKKSSKSCQKSKNLKGLKSRKCHWLGGIKLFGLQH